MIERTLYTSRGRLKVSIPTLLNEVTLGKMMALQELSGTDEAGTISLLSGIPVAELRDIIDEGGLTVFSEYVRSLASQIRYLYDSHIIPRKVTLVLGKRRVTVKVIRNLSIEPADAFIAARNIIADEINRHIDLYGEEEWKESFQPSLRSCAALLAQFFFCRATGKKYDGLEAALFGEEIKQLSVTDALPIARHFFSAYPDLLKQHFSWLERLRLDWRRRQVIRKLKGKRSF
jgi:hypothetical protein